MFTIKSMEIAKFIPDSDSPMYYGSIEPGWEGRQFESLEDFVAEMTQFGFSPDVNDYDYTQKSIESFTFVKDEEEGVKRASREEIDNFFNNIENEVVEGPDGWESSVLYFQLECYLM